MPFLRTAITALAVTLLLHTNGVSAQQEPAQKTLGNPDVNRMVAAGLADDVIVTAIEQAPEVNFQLTADDLIALRTSGVSDRVIQAMQKAAARKAGPIIADAAPSREPCRIFITEDDPPSGSYVVVKKEVQVGKKFYGSHDDRLMTNLAREADKVKADAIIKFHEWRAPSMWSWAAAKAGGMAVKWTAEGKAAISTLKGQCWSPVAQK
jgi:hypothetical protein